MWGGGLCPIRNVLLALEVADPAYLLLHGVLAAQVEKTGVDRYYLPCSLALVCEHRAISYTVVHAAKVGKGGKGVCGRAKGER